VMSQYNFTADMIFNCDETGLITVTDPPKVFSQKGLKQAGQATTAERGALVTMLSFVCANGNSIPPVFIFPGVQFREYMLHDAPTGSLGLAHRSGWMTEDNFFLSLKHFVKYVKATKETPALLLLDNHESHISFEVVSYAKEHHVVLLTFPPHCSHRLQPLDVTVYGPFKDYFKTAQNEWMLANPEKTLNIYQMASLAKKAYLNAFTPKNISAGFSSSGIYPFDRNIFQESDLLSLSETDHPIASTSRIDSPLSPPTPPNSENLNPVVVTPELIIPYSKAPQRKEICKSRKQGSMRILTEKTEIEEYKLKMEQRAKQIKKRNMTVRKFLEFSSSEESDVTDVELQDSDETDELLTEIKPGDDNAMVLDNAHFTLEINDFVLVNLSTKKHKLAYIGCITDILDENEYKIKFLRRRGNSQKFCYPLLDDVSDILRDNILLKLARPYSNAATSRTQATLKFNIEFSAYESKFGRIL